jgi:translation initiation factor IF-3
MDLVEVAPNDRPPVCRIMDYGKWKYRQNKKEQKSHKHHVQQLKEVRLRPKTDIHDRDYKIKHARVFLLEGDRVQFTMMFRGREMAHQDLGYQRMREIAEGLADVAKVETPAKMAGKRMTMVVTPLKKGGPKPGGTGKEEAVPAGASAPANGASPAGAAAPAGSQPVPAAPPAAVNQSVPPPA